MKLLLLAWLRESLRRPILLILSMLGVALGVATVVAIDIANESARRSFIAANEAVAGTATHRLDGMISDDLYTRLRLEHGLQATPVVEGSVRIRETGEKATLYGIDLLAEQNFQSNPIWNSLGMDVATELISRPFTIILSADTAAKLDLNAGEALIVSAPAGDVEMTVAGILFPANPLQAQSLRSVLITDIATAQDTLGMVGRLSSIQLTLDQSEITSLLAVLPDNVRMESNSYRLNTRISVTRAFQINLNALGLLSLLVAMFLIYNTTVFMVMRRHRLIGIARCVGALRGSVISCVLIEAAIIGCIATVAGFVLGTQLSNFLLALVERSIDSLYFPFEASVRVVAPQTIATGIALGVCATILSAIPAAKEALQVSPVHLTHSSQTAPARTFNLTLAGVLMAGAGAVALLVESRSVVLGFAGIFLIIVGYMLTVPFLIASTERFLRPAVKKLFGVQGILVARAFSVSLNKTSIAIVALSLAISATVGMGVMIGSFRVAVDEWLGSRLTGDIYVTTSSELRQNLTDADIGRLERLSEVDLIGVARWVKLHGPRGETRVFAVDYGQESFNGFEFKERDAGDVWTEFEIGSVIISEPYAYKNQLAVNDKLALSNGDRSVEFPIAGIYYDYSSDQGVVTMHRETYLKHFNDSTVTTAAVFASAKANVDKLADRVREAVATEDARIWRNRELHETSLAVFDQTFAITGVLRTLAIIVALIAVLSALATLQIERERELAVLRATGFTVFGIWRSASVETGVMGLLAAIISLPIGVVMAWLLIWVINQRSFGWTMQLQLDPVTLVQAVALAFVAATLAGIIPAWRLAKRVPARSLQSLD